MTYTHKLYAIYKMTSDTDGLPDDVMVFCDTCAAYPSSRTLIQLDDASTSCDGCRP